MTVRRATRTFVLAGAVVALLASFVVDAAASHAGGRSRSGRIAFLRLAADGSSRLFTIGADRRNLRLLTPIDLDVASFKWSPDGKRIAYLDRKGALRLVRPDGRGRELLAAASPLRSPWSLAWSPHGTSVAVLSRNPDLGPPPARYRSGHLSIEIIPTGGGMPRFLATQAEDAELAWSPRGDEIVYFTNGRAWAIRSDGSDNHPLHIYGLFDPTWSPDGTHLGFTGHVHVLHGRRTLAEFYGAIYIADANGQNLHLVTSHAYNEYAFTWSPDGRNILYGREHRQGIYAIGADGRNDRRLTHDSPTPTLHPALAWSPDGRSIAYETDRTGNGDIYVLDADGHHKARITSSPALDTEPAWQPHGA